MFPGMLKPFNAKPCSDRPGVWNNRFIPTSEKAVSFAIAWKMFDDRWPGTRLLRN